MPILVPVFVRSYKSEVNLGHEAFKQKVRVIDGFSRTYFLNFHLHFLESNSVHLLPHVSVYRTSQIIFSNSLA